MVRVEELPLDWGSQKALSSALGSAARLLRDAHVSLSFLGGRHEICALLASLSFGLICKNAECSVFSRRSCTLTQEMMCFEYLNTCIS